jgi:hypothetical protein
VNIDVWQQRNCKAREEDQKALHDRLDELESNQDRLAEMFSMYPCKLYLRMAYNVAVYARRATP